MAEVCNEIKFIIQISSFHFMMTCETFILFTVQLETFIHYLLSIQYMNPWHKRKGYSIIAKDMAL